MRKAIVTLRWPLLGRESRAVLDRLPGQLSEGEKHRVALAQVLIREPMLVILDEPTGTMDPITKIDVKHSILHAREEMEETFIVVSHDMDFVRDICDRLALMRGGKIIKIGPAEVRAPDRGGAPRAREAPEAAMRRSSTTAFAARFPDGATLPLPGPRPRFCRCPPSTAEATANVRFLTTGEDIEVARTGYRRGYHRPESRVYDRNSAAFGTFRARRTGPRDSTHSRAS
jgi:energy-coupling factor transporter ATP-binding protein EcfA2